MQETTSYVDTLSNRQQSTSSQGSIRLITAIIPVLIIAIVAGSLAGLQWAGQRGIALGYPLPQVQMTVSTTGALIRTQEYQFSAQASGRDLSYSWDFGDQSTGNGAIVSHAYQSNNTFTVTITVTDGAGHQATQSTTITVIPPAPQAFFTYSSGFSSGSIDFDASNSSADASTSIASYNWDFGDGSSPVSSSSPQYTYYYANSGTYRVTLTVVDATGQTSSPYTASITIP